MKSFFLLGLFLFALNVFGSETFNDWDPLVRQLLDGPDREQAYIKLLESADPPAPWHTQRIDGFRTIKHVALCPQHSGPPIIAVFFDYPGVLMTRSTNTIQSGRH